MLLAVTSMVQPLSLCYSSRSFCWECHYGLDRNLSTWHLSFSSSFITELLFALTKLMWLRGSWTAWPKLPLILVGFLGRETCPVNWGCWAGRMWVWSCQGPCVTTEPFRQMERDCISGRPGSNYVWSPHCLLIFWLMSVCIGLLGTEKLWLSTISLFSLPSLKTELQR